MLQSKSSKVHPVSSRYERLAELSHTDDHKSHSSLEIECKTNNNTNDLNQKILPTKTLKTPKKDGISKDKDSELMEIARSLSAEQKKITFLRLLKQSAPEKRILLLGVFFTFLASITYLLTPILMGTIIDSISSSTTSSISGPSKYFCSISFVGCSTPSNLLKTAILILFSVAIFSAIFSFGKWFTLEMAGERVVARLRKQLFSNIMNQEIGMFDMNKTGELINRLSSDTTILKSACTTQIAQTLQSMITVVLSIAYVFYLSWKLTLVMLSVVPVIIIAARLYGNYYRLLSKINQDRLADATQVATESISLIRTVKSFSKEDVQIEHYSNAIQLTYEQGVKMAFANGIWMAFFTIISNIGIGGVLWYGSSLVIAGQMRAGDLATYIMLTIQIGFSFARFIALYSVIMKALGASERVFQLIDRQSNIPPVGGDTFVDDDVNNCISDNEIMDGYIQIENVTFAYPSRLNMNVLENMSLVVQPGKITALVGESGAGKSTIAKLVMRFYDVCEGRILIDGKLIQNYDLRWLHTHIGFVSQEPVLFGTSIRENIIFGTRRTIFSDEEIVDAAKTANAHNFIMRFPEQYLTLVGERGIRLSGGQKQRIAIARAILMNPRILLLDEATSALDSESEHLVQQALDRVMVDRSVLVIAHRLSTVKNADHVLVIENGVIAEQGTHEQLIEKDGIYVKLVRRQLFEHQ